MFTTAGILIFFTLLVIFLAGPRVDRDTTLHPLNLPEDIDTYLQSCEATVGDLVPGTETTILWAAPPGVKTPVSVIYLHGFSATRREAAPLAEIVAENLGANLFYTRFSGHGRGGAAMLECSVNAYANDIHEAVEIGRRIGEKVIVIGLSTGGTAAMWMAMQPMTEHVAAYVLISPNFGLADKRSLFLTWPWGGQIAELVQGPEYSWEPRNELHGRFWTCRFPTRALLPMMEFVKLTLSMPLGSISQDMLVIYSPNDQIVSPEAIKRTFSKIGSNRKRLIEVTDTDAPNSHVLAGNILAPASTEKIAGIIIEFVKGKC